MHTALSRHCQTPWQAAEDLSRARKRCFGAPFCAMPHAVLSCTARGTRFHSTSYVRSNFLKRMAGGGGGGQKLFLYLQPPKVGGTVHSRPFLPAAAPLQLPIAGVSGQLLRTSSTRTIRKKMLRPRHDSNVQSRVPETRALSIRPRGQYPLISTLPTGAQSRPLSHFTEVDTSSA